MKISTRGRYGLRAMIDITAYREQGQGPIATHTIAERQGISERYLEQLMVPLKRAGLIKSVRGPQGGYTLAKNPDQIKAGDVIRILEGPLAPVDCVSEVNPNDCHRAGSCVTRRLWTQVRDSVTAILDSYSLAELARDLDTQKNAIGKIDV